MLHMAYTQSNWPAFVWLQELENVVALAGPGGPVIFAGAYVASTVLLFPASLLTLGAGFLYGESLL